MPARGRFLPEDGGATHESSTVRQRGGYGKGPPHACLPETLGHSLLALTTRCPQVPRVPFSAD